MKVLLFFFISVSLFAQENFLTIYHPYKNKAELAIIAGNYDQATDAYNSAFKSVNIPLAKDIFNAAVCKFLKNDFEGAKPYLLKLAKKGISAERLEAKEAFGMSGIKNEWQNFKPIYNQIQSMASEKKDTLIWSDLKKLYKEELIENFNRLFTINNVAIDTVKKIETKEYKISLKKFLELQKTDSTNSFKNYSMVEDFKSDAIRKIDSLNELGSEKLIELIKEYGFLSEEDSFLMNEFVPFEFENYNNENIFGSRMQFKENFLTNRMGILLRKYRYSESYGNIKKDTNKEAIERTITDNAIVKGVESGKLNPESVFFLGYEDSVYNLNSISVFKIKIEDKTECSEENAKNDYLTFYKPLKLTKDQELSYNNLIQIFGLPSLEENCRKCIYAATKNEYFIFDLNFQLEETTVPSCFSANQMLKGAIKIE